MKYKIGDKVVITADTRKLSLIQERYAGEIKEVIDVDPLLERYKLKDAMGLWSDDIVQGSPQENDYKQKSKEKVYFSIKDTTTYCIYKKDNIILKTEAKLHPDDEYDYLTGVQIAFERMRFEIENLRFEPYLSSDGKTILCKIGEKSGILDAEGNELCVGDIVEKHVLGSLLRYKHFVTKAEGDFYVSGQPSSRIKNGHCKSYGGTRDFTFTRIKSYSDLTTNDELEGLIPILEPIKKGGLKYGNVIYKISRNSKEN